MMNCVGLITAVTTNEVLKSLAGNTSTGVETPESVTVSPGCVIP